MFSLVRWLVICNLTTETDAGTGDKTKSVVDGKICICDKDLVGVQVQQLAQSQNMIFNNSLEIPLYSEPDNPTTLTLLLTISFCEIPLN